MNLKSILKVVGLFLAVWLGLLVTINLMYAMVCQSFDLATIVQMLPVTALLCLPVAGMMLADYLRKN